MRGSKEIPTVSGFPKNGKGGVSCRPRIPHLFSGCVLLFTSRVFMSLKLAVGCEKILTLKVAWVVVVSNIFDFHPYLGKIPNLTNIFQMG